MKLNILIVDDHPLVIGGITTMLKDLDYIEIAGACKTGAEALQFLSINEPDIILLDINLPDTDGLILCGIIRKQNKRSKIICLTSVNETSIITKMLQQGANGYLLKNMERSELLQAIDVVMNGKMFLSREANDKLLEQYNGLQDAMENVPVVTRREKEVLKLLDQGLNGPQMAEKLFISVYTVETHRKNLMQKFNVNNTQLLLKNARAFRLLD